VAQDAVSLYNIAGQALGLRGKFITTSDKHRAVEVFNLWYEHVRKIIFASAWWGGVGKHAVLTLLVERTAADWVATDPAPGARYAYVLPSDFIHPRNLSTFNHFSISVVGAQRVLSTHEENPVLAYTADQTTISVWEPQLFMVMAHGLAAFTANTLTGDRQLALMLESKVNEMIVKAKSKVWKCSTSRRKVWQAGIEHVAMLARLHKPPVSSTRMVPC
jgi:hypothetical protein